MTDAKIDNALTRLAMPPRPVDPALLERIVRSVAGTVTPVKPLPPTWLLAGQLLLVSVLVPVAGAAGAGLDGIAVLLPWQRAIVLGSLGLLAGALARECVVRWIPGSRPRVSPAAALAGCCAALVLLYAVLFRDYRAEQFVAAGLACLKQGVIHAVPAAILGMLVLRRGFATRPVAAALIGGALAGLTGVAFLELHCSNVEAPHRLVWHAGVVPLSAALGALVAWLLARTQRAH